MKKIIAYVVLISVFILNSGAGCSDKKEEPEPEYVKLLVGGRWDVYKTYSESASDKITLTIKDGYLGYKFYTDGSMDGCFQQTCEKQGRWSYKVKNAAAGTGELTLYNDNKDIAEVYGDQLIGHLEILSDNEIIWVVNGSPFVGNTDYSLVRWYMKRTQ
ncbi:hypothetical protein GVN20_12025 [Runella sp. CRIBMP]|uniref:hypothetical protein n=1 Tax=Runella sp. CRIBMP TaxID=2683261 RepID=UPI0014121703|nr:hypothetical protein [Runella sp. CRIBMP]NBB20083.1 hypothetical protein [Runella sp. CRIBMP]